MDIAIDRYGRVDVRRSRAKYGLRYDAVSHTRATASTRLSALEQAQYEEALARQRATESEADVLRYRQIGRRQVRLQRNLEERTRDDLPRLPAESRALAYDAPHAYGPPAQATSSAAPPSDFAAQPVSAASSSSNPVDLTAADAAHRRPPKRFGYRGEEWERPIALQQGAAADPMLRVRSTPDLKEPATASRPAAPTSVATGRTDRPASAASAPPVVATTAASSSPQPAASGPAGASPIDADAADSAPAGPASVAPSSPTVQVTDVADSDE